MSPPPSSLVTEVLVDVVENISGINKRNLVLNCGSFDGSSEDFKIHITSLITSSDKPIFLDVLRLEEI